jgi:hypothetical protein
LASAFMASESCREGRIVADGRWIICSAPSANRQCDRKVLGCAPEESICPQWRLGFPAWAHL